MFIGCFHHVATKALRVWIMRKVGVKMSLLAGLRKHHQAHCFLTQWRKFWQEWFPLYICPISEPFYSMPRFQPQIACLALDQEEWHDGGENIWRGNGAWWKVSDNREIEWIIFLTSQSYPLGSSITSKQFAEYGITAHTLVNQTPFNGSAAACDHTLIQWPSHYHDYAIWTALRGWRVRLTSLLSHKRFLTGSWKVNCSQYKCTIELEKCLQVCCSCWVILAPTNVSTESFLFLHLLKIF